MPAVCLVHAGDLSELSGGTDRVGAFAAGLVDRGFDVTVVAPTPDGDLPAAFDDATLVPVDTGTRGLVDQPVRAVRVVRRARRVADERDATLQILHSTLAGVAALLGCSGYVLDMADLACRSPLYGDLPLGSAVQRVVGAIEGRGLHAADSVVVVSERMAALVAERWDVDPGALTVIPNGYDPSRVGPYRDVETVDGRVAFLGTLHRKVDVEALCAVAQLPAVDDLVVVGDGERRRELADRADGIPALRVLGRLPDEEAFPLVASAAVAINPQRASGLQEASSPVKLYYYAALGCPMVLSSGPDEASWLAEADAAELVPPGGDFAGAVDRLLGDSARREALGAAAESAVAEATWDSRAATLAAHYNDTVLVGGDDDG